MRSLSSLCPISCLPRLVAFTVAVLIYPLHAELSPALIESIESINSPSKVPVMLLDMGRGVRSEAFHNGSKTNPIFEAAWARNESGFIGHWDDQLEARVLSALKAGVPIDQRDSHGRTALMHAVLAPNSGLYYFLKRMGARVDLVDELGLNIHHLSVINQFKLPAEIARTVRNAYHGIDITETIFTAVTQNDLRGLDVWFTRGISPNYPEDITGFTLLGLAANQSNNFMVDFLISRGADLNFSKYESWNILSRALNDRNFVMAKFLISRGADPYFTDKLRLSDGSDLETWIILSVLIKGFVFYGSAEYLDFIYQLERSRVPVLVINNTLNYVADYFSPASLTAKETDRLSELVRTIPQLFGKKMCGEVLREAKDPEIRP